MKAIIKDSNNIYYLFNSSLKYGKRKYFEDIFVPKFFLNLYNLGMKKKISDIEDKKLDYKDYLLYLNSYFKKEKVNNKRNTYAKNKNNNNKNINVNKKKNIRFFSANIKKLESNLPKIKYIINENICNNSNKNKNAINNNIRNSNIINKKSNNLKSINDDDIIIKNTINKIGINSINKDEIYNININNSKQKPKRNILNSINIEFIPRKPINYASKTEKEIKIKHLKQSLINANKNYTINTADFKGIEKINIEDIKLLIESRSKILNLQNERNNSKNSNINLDSSSFKNISDFNHHKNTFSSKKKEFIKNLEIWDKSITKNETNKIYNFFTNDNNLLKKEKDNNIKKYSFQNIKHSNNYKDFKLSDSLLKNYFFLSKKKAPPKLSKILRVDTFKIKYKAKEEIINLFSDKIIGYTLLNNNILNMNEKFYFNINKKYRNQLVKYMEHRINWEYCDIKESKNIENCVINFEWKYYSNKVNFKKFKYEQNTPLKKLKVINLFEKNYEIGNKKNMFLNLISYCDEIGYNIFDIVPFTIILSNTKFIKLSFNSLKELMEFIPKEKDIKNNIITNRKYNLHFWYDRNYELINKQYINFNKNFISKKNYWIIKPPDLYQGKCIEISNDFNEIQKKCEKLFKGIDKTNIYELNNEEEEYYSDDNDEEEDNSLDDEDPYRLKPTKFYVCNDIIIQKYLDNPFLYKGRKFDIRCFVLVDSNLNVYFCKEGHLKGSSELYNLNETNKFIHITNYSFQKKSSKFEKFEIGNEISYQDFKKFLLKEGIPIVKFDNMINQMKFLIKLSFKSVRDKLIKINPVLCFEIFGYDFIIDNDFKPWILEINDNPGLGISSPVIEKLVPRMMDDAFRLTIDMIFNTKYSVNCFDSKGNYKSKFKLDGFNDDENIFEFLCNLK